MEQPFYIFVAELLDGAHLPSMPDTKMWGVYKEFSWTEWDHNVWARLLGENKEEKLEYMHQINLSELAVSTKKQLGVEHIQKSYHPLHYAHF